MKPRKKDYVKVAEQERNRLRNIAKTYFRSTPSIKNLYNGVRAFWNSLPLVGVSAAEMNPYVVMGDAPVAGKTKNAIRLLSPAQIKTLLPKDRNAYINAVDRITYRDAIRLRIKNDPQYFESQDALQKELGSRYADRNTYSFEDEYGFDPELELLEYNHGGTDSYDALYKTIMRRRNRAKIHPKQTETEDASINSWLLELYRLQNDPGYLRYIHGEGGIPSEIQRQGQFMDDEYFWYKYADTDPGIWKINNYNRALRGLPPTEF